MKTKIERRVRVLCKLVIFLVLTGISEIFTARAPNWGSHDRQEKQGKKDYCGSKSGSKSSRMAKLREFLQDHPKPAFSEKVQRGDQGKFFLNSPKKWCKWHCPVISIHLKCKNSRRFRRKQRLQRCPNGQVMAIFGRSPKTRIFWKKAKGTPRETFKKSPKKYASL